MIRSIKSCFGRFWLAKVVLFPVFVLMYLVYFPFLYYFYSRKLKDTSSQQQLFFLALDQFGVITPLLYYIRCWVDIRGDAILVVFTPHIELVKRLAQQICPSVKVISPPVMISGLVHSGFSVYSRQFVFTPLYHSLLREYPEALYINETRSVCKSVYVKYLDSVYKNRSHDSPFWDAYVQTRRVFDLRYKVTQDFFQLALKSSGIGGDKIRTKQLLKDLKISGRYAVVTINTKDYSNTPQNSRRIQYPERYNALIDFLIGEGFSVVLQGTNEQPRFESRQGLVDYAHSTCQSAENDIALICGCEFYVSSKSGTEWYSLICDKPILGLNYTELTSMQPNQRMRFFPKHIKNRDGNYLSWRTVLTHPIYFQLGRSLPTKEKFEFIEMEEYEIVAAVKEFLQLLPRPREQWLSYGPQQQEFKKMLHPGHLDLYYISGVPCEVYLQEEVEAESTDTENVDCAQVLG